MAIFSYTSILEKIAILGQPPRGVGKNIPFSTSSSSNFCHVLNRELFNMVGYPYSLAILDEKNNSNLSVKMGYFSKTMKTALVSKKYWKELAFEAKRDYTENNVKITAFGVLDPVPA